MKKKTLRKMQMAQAKNTRAAARIAASELFRMVNPRPRWCPFWVWKRLLNLVINI